MNCCHSTYCSASDGMFNARIARGSLERYRKEGPDRTTRLLVDSLVQNGRADGALLDIGGGIGALSIELLGAGIQRSTLVDASPSYLAAAREEVARRGLEERLEILHADFTRAAEVLPPTDVVVMNRVVCCFPDLDLLLNLALEHTRKYLALSYPRERWYTKAAITALNAYQVITRNPFRVFVHPEARMRAIFAQNSFRQVSQTGTLEWSVEVWERESA